MAKMVFSLGFWMTIVLFIALGYALGYVFDETGVGPSYRVTLTSTLHDKFQNMTSDLELRDAAGRDKCPSQTGSRDDDLRFRQFANLQGAERTYAPGLSFSITRHPDRITACPGPIEIPPQY